MGSMAVAPGKAEGQELAAPNVVDVANFDLESLLDKSISSVSRREEKSSQAPASVFVLTRDDIVDQGFRTIAEALRAVPGLSVSNDTSYPFVGVRGLNLLGDPSTRLLVLIDGHPMNGALGMGQSFWDRDLPVDLRALERIEVITGPVGSVYGPTAYFGVVNLVTRGASTQGGSAFVAGDADGLRPNAGEAGVYYGRRVGDFAFTLDLNFFRSNGHDYAFPELEGLDRPTPEGGSVAGADWLAAQNGYGTVSWKDLTLSFGWGDRKKGLPTAPYSTVVGDTSSFFYNRSSFAQLAWGRQLNDLLGLYARVSYDQFKFDDKLTYPEPPDDAGSFRDVGEDRWLSAEARVTLTPFKGHRDTLGVQFERHDTMMESRYVDLPTAVEDPVDGFGLGPLTSAFNTWNAYAMIEQTLFERLTLQGGLTFYSHELFGSRWTPKVALVWNITDDDNVKLIYSEGFRPPTIWEAQFEDGLDFIGNSELRPETVRSFEAIYERHVGSYLTVTGSVYSNAYRNMISNETVPAPDLGREPDPEDPSDFRQQNVNASRIDVVGGQVGFRLQYKRLVRAFGGLSVQGATFSSTQLSANFADVTANFALTTNFGYEPLSWSVNGSFVGPRRKDVANLLPGDRGAVDAYLLLNASVRYELPVVRGLSLQLTVHNLLDSAITDPIVGDHAPLTQVTHAGRGFRLLAQYDF